MNYQVAIAPLKLNWFKRQKLKKIIYKNLKTHMYCLGDMKSTYHTNASLHKLPEFSFFETKLNLFSQKILNRNIRICSMWANVGTHGSKVSPHNHIRDDYSDYEADHLFKTSGICGAYYLQKPKLSGNFISNDNVVDINENDLILFSPHMMHQTEINKSYKDRIVISFNGYLDTL
tara:strand:+ start:1758 stop:2282 length:525 start_codon:yes stop_codon:yes gene_type:complete